MSLKIESYTLQKIKNKNNFNRIVNEIKKIAGIESVHIDKKAQVLYFEIKEGASVTEAQILKAINKFEKNAEMVKNENKEVYRKVLYLKGLDCGNCAMKIENLAKRFMSYEQIVVDFATARFIIETSDRDLMENIISRVENVAHKVDPKIVVLDSSTGKKERVEETYRPAGIDLAFLVVGVILFLLGLLFKEIFIPYLPQLNNVLVIIYKISFVVSYIFVGYPVILLFFRNIKNKRLFDENFLMTIASIGALATGHYVEAVMVMFLYQIGERLQDFAVHKSRKSISELLTLEAETVKLKIGTDITEVDVESVLPGDIILVQVGEMIPLDGVISQGKTALDTASITGESAHVSAKPGDYVISGSVNIGSVIEVKVTKPYGESMITKILDLVENASSKKARAENFITKFAKVYTPVVVGLALIIAIFVPLFIFNTSGNTLEIGEIYKKYIYEAMVFLVISCPCAIVISVPLGFFAGIGLSSKRGILIKGSNYLEALSHVENVVFDKTGTLTKGEFAVREIIPANETITENEVLKNFAYVEYYSTHPIGLSILEAYGKDAIFPEIIAEYCEIKGKGVKALVNGTPIYAGNEKMMKEMFPNVEVIERSGVVFYLVRDKKYLGALVIGDAVRDEAAEAIKKLRKRGIKNFSMLTGDAKSAAHHTANLLKLDDVYSELLPDNKVEILEKIKANAKGKTIYVGDGINDAPVIATADVGIAMGNTGSDATIAIADVVIMSDNLLKLDDAIAIAKRTKKRVIENIIFSLIVKLFVLIISLFGVVPLWLAIFSDVGVSLLAIINSMTITRMFSKEEKQEVQNAK